MICEKVAIESIPQYSPNLYTLIFTTPFYWSVMLYAIAVALVKVNKSKNIVKEENHIRNPQGF